MDPWFSRLMLAIIAACAVKLAFFPNSGVPGLTAAHAAQIAEWGPQSVIVWNPKDYEYRTVPLVVFCANCNQSK